MEADHHLVSYSTGQAAENLSLVFRTTLSSDSSEKLESRINHIYENCCSISQELIGEEAMTYVYHLSERKLKIIKSDGKEYYLKRVSVTSFAVDRRCQSLKWEFEFEDHRETYTSPKITGIDEKLLTGAEYERIFPRSIFPLPKKGFWNVWEEQLPDEVKHYATTIDPRIVLTINKICKLNPSQELDIIDLGGGSGRLAAHDSDKTTQNQKSCCHRQQCQFN